MAAIAEIVEAMRASPQSIRFSDLQKACEHYFGEPHQTGGSHAVFKSP